jgi:DNA-binding NarL/FixJ family response regulator
MAPVQDDQLRVTIVEDLALLRDGLTRMLEGNGCEVIAAVDSASDFLASLEEVKPDVAIVDVRLPPTFNDEGVRAAIEARRRSPGLPVLILSQYVEQTYAAELLADGTGGVGYLLKDRVSDVREFVDAVRRVASGGMALDPEAVSQLVAGHEDGPLTQLSTRERAVLALMAEGRTNHGIADELEITSSGVEKHVASIFAKLGLPPADSAHRRVLAVVAWLGG